MVSFARKYHEFERRGVQIVGISVDTIADNAAMVQKLVLPFPLLSDPEGTLIQYFELWDSDERIAKPAIAVVDQAGSIVYLYSGQDFADRPGDTAIFETIERMERGGTYTDETPQIQVTADEARQSVRPDKKAKTLEELVPYYQGAFSASVALKGRMIQKGDRDAGSEITSYQRMVREYRDALVATVDLH